MVGGDKVHDRSGVELKDRCESSLTFGEDDVDFACAVGEGGDLFDERVRVGWIVRVMFMRDGVSKIQHSGVKGDVVGVGSVDIKIFWCPVG